MNKKYLIAGIVGVTMLSAALIVPSVAFADSTTQTTTFIQKLADKLGIDQSKVQTAVNETRDEMQGDRQAQFKEDLQTAVTNGKITQRQADLIIAVQEARNELRDTLEKPDFSTLQDLTMEERRAKMDEFRTQMHQKILDTLNAKGLNTTSDEITAAQQAARDADIMPAFGGRGHGGPGGMGMMF